MADQNIDMAELEIAFSDFSSMMNEFQRNGSLNVDQLIQLRKQNSTYGQAVAAAEAKLKLFSESVGGKAVKAVGTLAKGIGDSAMQARQNRESFASLNPVIDAAASALSAIPVVGDALGKTLSTVGKFVTDELDQSVKAFQNLGSVGGIGAQGVSGLRKSAEAAGLSFQQLSQVVTNNSGNLAFAFGGTATGLQKIAALTQAAEPFRGELLALGLSFQEQSELFTEYAERQAKLGNLQGRSTADLAASSAAYAKNLTDLSRITGMSVDAAEAEQDAQMSNIRFRKALSGVDEDVAESISNVGVVIAGLGKDPELTRGFQDLVAGFGTEAATNFTIATGGVGKEVADLLKAGAITEQEAMQRLQGAFQQTYEKLPAQVLGVGTAFDNTALGMANLATAQIDYNTALQQGKDAAKAADPATKQMVDAQLALQRFAVEADTFVNNNVFPNATAVIGKLANGLADLAGQINGVVSGGTGGGSGGGFWDGLKRMFSGGATSGMGADDPMIGGAAMGGPIKGGNPYMVGELGPELVIPNSSSTVIPAKQLVGLFDQIKSMPTRGGPTLAEGLNRTFLPGIGFMNEYAMAGLRQKEIRDFGGNVLGQQGQFQLFGETGLGLTETLSGPKNSYASSVLGSDAISSLRSTPYDVNGGEEKFSSKQGLMTQEMAETLISELRTISQNTRTGADASKKLVRAQS